MFREGSPILTILGRVKPKDILTILPVHKLHENQGWFYVDYAIEKVGLNTKFDVFLKGETKQLVSAGACSIKLLACFDQFAHQFEGVPEGYKTICKFEFQPSMPDFIKKLPVVSGWKYYPEAISIADHKDIELAVPDLVWEDFYKIAFIQLKDSVSKRKTKSFSRVELVNSIEKSAHVHTSTANNIVQSLMQLGRVTKNENNLLELEEIDF